MSLLYSKNGHRLFFLKVMIDDSAVYGEVYTEGKDVRFI